jgi:hypothetical protein
MSQTFDLVTDLVARDEVRVSLHGQEELQADGIRIREVLSGLSDGFVVEDYPDFGKGPCVLLLQRDAEGQAIHIVWGIPKGKSGPAVIVTGYRPDKEMWEDNFLRRLT